jgi:hypothetical protein
MASFNGKAPATVKPEWVYPVASTPESARPTGRGDLECSESEHCNSGFAVRFLGSATVAIAGLWAQPSIFYYTVLSAADLLPLVLQFECVLKGHEFTRTNNVRKIIVAVAAEGMLLQTDPRPFFPALPQAESLFRYARRLAVLLAKTAADLGTLMPPSHSSASIRAASHRPARDRERSLGSTTLKMRMPGIVLDSCPRNCSSGTDTLTPRECTAWR